MNPHTWHQPLTRIMIMTATACLLLPTICTLAIAPLAASEMPLNEITLDDVKAGSLLLPVDGTSEYAQVPALDTDIFVEVTGLSAHHTIRQTFSNPGDRWLEALYVYPLPDSATVDELIMIIGDQRILGEIQTRTKARQNYETAKDNGQRASLVERQRPNLFTTRVANIPPYGEIRIEIGFQADIRYDDGVFGLRLPLTMTPRYIPGGQLPRSTFATFKSDEPFDQNIDALADTTSDVSNAETTMRPAEPIVTTDGWGHIPGLTTEQVADAHEITPPMTHTVPDATLQISISSGLTLDRIYSSSHSINVTEDDLHYTVTLPSGLVPMDRDFSLQWHPLPGSSPLAAVFTQQGRSDSHAATESITSESETYASIMLVPPQHTQDKATPSREVIFVIDKSGSMDGNSLLAAKKALVLGIRGLDDDDTFNIVMFNDQTSTLYRYPRSATQSQKQNAVASVRRISAGGGTEIMGALNAALATTSNSARVRQIVFITDGSVGNEAEIFNQVQRRLGNNRIFTVGIGTAPNRWFMRKTAELGRGAYTVIADSSEAVKKMTALFHKLERPVLNNLRLQFSGADNIEFYPATVPDLYASEPVLIDLRCIGSLDGAELQISGDENGVPWSRTLVLDTHTDNKQTGLDKLWARRKITELENSLLFNNNTSDVKHQATQTALEYGLVSRYTSLVAIEQSIARNTSTESVTTRQIPLAVPAGSNMHAPSITRGSQTQTSQQSAPRVPAVSVPQTQPDGSPMPIPQGNLGIVLHLLMSLVMSSSVAAGAWLTRRRKHAAV